eukprot:JP436023.1.p2 GENE.JP436023.1~~JP436023.1.p2  ORF type:complete len:141 (-),score=65.38 JP436023.1:447-869(-)
MKADWEALGTEFEGSSVVVGDVDCTDQQDLCQTHGVQGYPTIKYYADGDREGKPYQSGRDLASLKKFTEETLQVQCDVKSEENCSEKEIKFIGNFKAKTAEQRKAEITRLNGMKTGSMKPDLKKWLVQRLNILAQLTKDE